MTVRGKSFVAGVYEHPARIIPDKSVSQVAADVAIGALADAGLQLSDVDALFCGRDLPGFGAVTLADYLGLNALKYLDANDLGGTSYLSHVGHAAAAIVAGKCSVALIVCAGLARQPGWIDETFHGTPPSSGFEDIFGLSVPSMYALAARRHMHQFGTTSAQLAEIKVAAAHHAQFNSHALLQDPVTVEEVLASPMVSDPLHRLDCCVITDGGGAIVVVSPEVARDLDRRCVKLLGHGESAKYAHGGRNDLTYTGAAISGPRAFEEAGVKPTDIDYASIYDSFTITVLETIEDLGFCEKGKGGEFVRNGTLQAPFGKLPFNTDGGGLCNNHPGFRGGVTKAIEAVRQLRGEANSQVQVPNCELAVAHGTGGLLSARAAAVTLILGQEDA